jgi:hypothetical protein
MRLGFSKIGVLGRDVIAAGSNRSNVADFGNSVGFGGDIEQLLALAQRGVKGIAITGSFIDRKLLTVMKENGCILVLPLNAITASRGIVRTKNIYRMSKLYRSATKLEIPVAFVSMAKTQLYMNSYMQLIELANLVCADRSSAAHCISEVNKKLVMRI